MQVSDNWKISVTTVCIHACVRHISDVLRVCRDIESGQGIM